MKDAKSIRQDIFDKVMDVFDKNSIKYTMSEDAKRKFINNEVNIYGEAPLILSVYDAESMSKLTSLINKDIASLGGHAKRDSYNTLYVYYDDSMLVEPTKEMVDESADDLALPEPDKETVTVEEILNATNKKKIYLTSDWHFFKNHYKHEANYVNTQKIVTWCRQNIKDDDVFMYLGDISFRYANEKDQKESARILNTLPGIKILILGNHDLMLGDEYYTLCGFDYVFQTLEWNNLIFTHRPINMETYPNDYLNIHGHIHNLRAYNTCDGKRNVNVYPMFYDNKPVTLDYILNHVEELVKDNYWNKNYGYGESYIDDNDEPDIVTETKRSELPDSAFGIPEDRKYPLDTEKHVQSAIKLFGHAEESKKHSLAKRIKAAAKKYDISIPENTQCYKYLTEGGIEDIIPADVKAIVFDMGSVLVTSDMEHMIMNGLHISEYLAHTMVDYVKDVLFHNEEKLEDYTEDEAKQYFMDNTPDDMHKYIDDIFGFMLEALHPYEYVDSMLEVLRRRGYKLYYLSNWPLWSYNIEKPFFDKFTKNFDGGMFSCHSAYMKPDERFYLQFFKKFNLDPKECFFFDDKAENINAGERVGMRGYLFNSEETPWKLLDNSIVAPVNANTNALVSMDGLALEAVNVSEIDMWYCGDDDKNVLYYDNFNSMVDDIADGIDSKIYKKVFIRSRENEEGPLIPFGVICVEPNKDWHWFIQYPLNSADGMYVLNEYSMAAVNPIIGINKPFIVKIGLNNVFGADRYAFSPDIISDKYLVIDEEAHLVVADKSILEDCNVEVYEFIGDKRRLSKLAEAYTTNKIVDNTVFYTALTGKPMLCPDQIDYDTANFRKVNFEQMVENAITDMATVYNGYLESIGYGACWTSVLESTYVDKIDFLSKYKNSDVSVREDFDGYYVYSELTKKRSRSVATPSLITEEMVISIL